MIWRMVVTVLCFFAGFFLQMEFPGQMRTLLGMGGLVGLQLWLCRGLWRLGMRDHTRES